MHRSMFPKIQNLKFIELAEHHGRNTCKVPKKKVISRNVRSPDKWHAERDKARMNKLPGSQSMEQCGQVSRETRIQILGSFQAERDFLDCASQHEKGSRHKVTSWTGRAC